MTAVTVHLGLSRTGTTTLQTQYFSQAPEIAWLGKKTGEEALDQQSRLLSKLRPHEVDLDKVRKTLEAKIAATPGVPLYSDEDLTSWRFMNPREMGRRTGEVFHNPKLLFVPRRPTDWALSRYYFNLSLFRRDTFAGPNPWLEKHLSQLRIGSNAAEITFTYTLDTFAKAADASQVLILPYELMLQDRPTFLGQIEDYLGVPGALTRIQPAVDRSKARISRQQANFFRVLSFYRKDQERFLHLAELICSRARRDVAKDFAPLAANPETTLEQWAGWFRKTKRTTFRAMETGDEALISALDVFGDYDIRKGLMAHLMDVEREETEAMFERHGVNLRPWGYGADPAA